MRKLISIFLTLCLLLGITACSATQPPEETGSVEIISPESESNSEDNNNTDSSTEAHESTPDQPEASEAQSNILIAYFTWAENTSVADPDSVDVDAVTSASVLMPGNVGLLA